MVRLGSMVKIASKGRRPATPANDDPVNEGGAERQNAGGAATGGGINFQAAVTAIAYTYALRGRPLKWLDGLHEDVPVSVAAETGEGGDDIQIVLRGGTRCDIQVKRGLRQGVELWNSLMAMGAAIAKGKTEFGVLAVSPNSSDTVREKLARAIIRIGAGRTDGLPEVANSLIVKFTAADLSPSLICRALRIVTISAATHDGASLAAARAELGHICSDSATIDAAWNVLYRDAVELIDSRSRRDISSLVQLLKSNGINLARDTASPASLLASLAEWTIKTSSTFSIFGVRRPLRLSEAWIPLYAVVREEQAPHPDLMAELNAYHSWHEREHSRESTKVDPETLGRFIKLGVVVAGPGMGKTTLLSRIALAYANDGIPVLRVRLGPVAARIHRGDTFEEAVLALGLEGSSISPANAEAADIRNWVLLCDGLDETGAAQTLIASAVARFTKGHPECRVIVTTRPIGYQTSELKAWRHYDILPLEKSSAYEHLAQILREIRHQGLVVANDAERLARSATEEDITAKAVTRSPFLLSLAASVIARGGSLGVSRTELYKQLFTLVDDAPNSRLPEPPAESVVLVRFLDLLGWQIVSNPIASIDTVVNNCANTLVEDLAIKPLSAKAAALSCLRYWQDIGIVERIGLRGSEILTFLHKTFAEFSAARFLIATPLAERKSILLSIYANELWNETVEFAAIMGIAPEVCDALMDEISLNAPGIERIVRCLDICGEAELPPNEQTRTAIFDFAFQAIQSPRRQWAIKIGLAMLPVARRFGGEVARRCAALVSHPQSWTRLAAWAALAETGPAHLDFARLQIAIRDEALLVQDKSWLHYEGHFVLDSGTGRKLAQAFVLAGARQLLEQWPGEASDEAVFAACRIEDLGSMDFLRRASQLLKDHGKPDDIWPKSFGSAMSIFPSSIEFFEAQQKAYAALFEAIDGGCDTNESIPTQERKRLYLSAFLRVTDYLEQPLSDIWQWVKPFDPEPVRETLRAAVGASGIPVDGLKQDIRIARSGLGEFDASPKILQFYTDVDIPNIDWKLAAMCSPNIEMIEAALYHRSHWLVLVAANLIHALVDGEELQNICCRAIANGHGYTLSIAAGLAVDLDKPKMTTAIYDRLQNGMTSDCYYLLLALPNLQAPADSRLLSVLETGFLSGTLETAIAASKVAIDYASPASLDLFPILEKAAAHWEVREQPYPINGGAIPESPRANIAKATTAIYAHTYENLKRYAADSRWDVQSYGIKALVERLCEQPQLASTFLADIEAGKLAPTILDKTLTSGVSWHEDSFSRVRALLTSSNSGLRYAAMAVLHPAYCSIHTIQDEARRMTTDLDRQITDRAYRILDAVPSIE